MRSWQKRARTWSVLMAAGGGLLALDSCDPTVRSTMLSGMGSAASSIATTFIQAFFESLNKPTSDPNAPPTVQAKPFVPAVFA